MFIILLLQVRRVQVVRRVSKAYLVFLALMAKEVKEVMLEIEGPLDLLDDQG